MNELEIYLKQLERGQTAYRRTATEEMMMKPTKEAIDYIRKVLRMPVMDTIAGVWLKFGEVTSTIEKVVECPKCGMDMELRTAPSNSWNCWKCMYVWRLTIIGRLTEEHRK